jgi:hypothetical protein
MSTEFSRHPRQNDFREHSCCFDLSSRVGRVLPNGEIVVHWHNVSAGARAVRDEAEFRNSCQSGRAQGRTSPLLCCSGQLWIYLKKYECEYSHTRIAPQNERLLARRQLPVGRSNLSLRQSIVEASAETVGREAAGGWTLGHDAGPEFHLCTSELDHQEI